MSRWPSGNTRAATELELLGPQEPLSRNLPAAGRYFLFMLPQGTSLTLNHYCYYCLFLWIGRGQLDSEGLSELGTKVYRWT